MSDRAERRRAQRAGKAAPPTTRTRAGQQPQAAPPREERPRPPRIVDRRIFPPLEPDPALEREASWPWLLPAILGVGLTLRLIHLILVRQAPFFSLLVLDARYYDEWARRIADGVWIGRNAFWVDPLYAYVLSFVYRLAGHDLLLPRVVNIGFGLATAVVVWRTAWVVWRSRFAAAAATLLFVLFVPAILFEGQIEKTALSVFLLAAATYLFLLTTPRAIVAAGVVAGLATLARGNAAAFLPLAAIALALGWDCEPGLAALATSRQRLWRAGLFLAGALPVVALATAHNYAATGEFVPTTTNLGINLYIGNHPDNQFGYYDAPDFLHPNTESEVPDFRAEAQRRTGRSFTDNELSKYWAGQTWETIKQDPARFLALVSRKLRLALHNDEIPDSEGVALVALWSPVLRTPLIWFGQLVPLGVLGAVVGWRRRGVRIMLAVALIYLATLLPFFLMARLRVQLVPPLAVLAGGSVSWLVTAARTRRTRSLLYAGAVLAASAFVVFYRPPWMAERRVASLAIQWNNLAASLADLGRNDEAIQAWEHAVETDPKAVPVALRMLGSQYQARGDYLRAEGAMRHLLELKPDSRSGREALAKLYDRMLQDPRWRNDAQVQRKRQALGGPSAPAPAAAAPAASANPAAAAIAKARALQKEGRTDDAIAALEEAVRTGPYDENLNYMLGSNMERHSTPEAMIAFWSEHVSRDQKPQTSHYFWAVGLARQGNVDGAIGQLQQALEIDPAHEMSQRQWGLLLEQQGRLDESLQHLTEATRIHPEYKAALEDAARVAEHLGRSDDAQSYRSRAATANPSSDRQYVYWARYLHEHGRDTAAWAEIHHMLAAHPQDAEALALRDQIQTALGGAVPPVTEPAAPAAAAPAPAAAAVGGSGSAASGWHLTADGRAQLIAGLTQQPAGTPVWIVYDGRDAAAQDGAKQLGTAFTEAGWTVRQLDQAPVAMRPGLFLFAADDPPSAAAQAVESALQAAQLTATIGTGYRAFADERRRADPNWHGIQLAPDQGFVLAVGRPPA